MPATRASSPSSSQRMTSGSVVTCGGLSSASTCSPERAPQPMVPNDQQPATTHSLAITSEIYSHPDGWQGALGWADERKRNG